MSGICAGTPITAPNGYQNLRAGTMYYFLRSSPSARLVTLVEFARRRTKEVVNKKGVKKNLKPLPFPLVIRIQRVDFEEGVLSCRIPDDCIDSKRYPLFMARAVLQELIESLQSTRGVKPC